LRATDADPAKRYSTAREFADTINKAIHASATEKQSRQIMSVSTEPATLVNPNVIIRTIIPENPCGACGQENRKTSRFCRRCGHRLDETSPLVTDVCQVGYVSDTGHRYVAAENEDMLLIVQGLCANLAPPPRPFGLFAVADGLRGPQGKSAGGHEASRLAIETIADVLLPLLATSLPSQSSMSPGNNSFLSQRGLPGRTAIPASPPDTILEQWLKEGVRRANQVIYHCNADYETSMASTLTTALVYKHRLYITNIGDSRAYHYSPAKGLTCVTTDHSLAANLVEAKIFKPEEIYSNAKNKQLYRYLGQANHIQIDFFEREVELNDLILLCTNGLWHMVRDERLKELLAQGGDPQKLARALVDEANLAGGEGNVSAIVVGVQ
jgi:serine/threonine protein phosphatase PrpC